MKSGDHLRKKMNERKPWHPRKIRGTPSRCNPGDDPKNKHQTQKKKKKIASKKRIV